MKKKVISVLLVILLPFLLALISNIQQLQTVPEVVAEPTSVPPFVNENKLVYESGATYQWLDPHVSYYQYDYWTLWHSVEMLVWYERDNATKIIPWLAEDWDVSSDGLHYNFTLRQGITFQDGTPFNATAVWFSLNRLLIIDGTSGTGTPGSQAAWMTQQLLNHSLSTAMSGETQPWDAAWVQAVLDQNFVEIIDEYTVKLNIWSPTTQFLPILAGPWAAIVSPSSTIEMDYAYGGWGTWDGDYNTYFLHMAGNGDTAFNRPEDGWRIGTGAYYIESVEPTYPYMITLKAYDDYWGGPNNMNLPPAGKTRIETIEYKYVPSFTTRLLDLKAGTATGIAVPTDNIFQVVDRDKWIDEEILESIIPGVSMHGIFPQFTTWWLCFSTNVTKPVGGLRDWQPFADWRIRMAVASSVNMTDMNINVNTRLGVLASNIVPPDTAPPHAYADIGVTFSYDLDYAEELLLQANATPLTSFTFYNGTPVPGGIVDNSFGPDFAHPKTVEFYVQAGADTFQAVLTQMADALNNIADDNDLGIRFNVVIVPGGQQYTLASSHLIDSYMGGWIADYNHVLNWLHPMYLSTGMYFSWNLWNLTALDDLYWQAVAADEAGDVDELLSLTDQMNTIANEHLTYMMWWHPTAQFARSTWLQGWYYNPVYGVDIWSSMYYETPMLDVTPPTTTISPSGDLGDNGWFTSDVTVTLSATDDLSGINKIEYSFDNATWLSYATPFTITTEGTLTVYYRSTDKADNRETTKSETIKIDKTPASGSIIIENDAIYETSTSVTLAISATDATSGVTEMRFSDDNITYTEWQTYASSKSWTLQEGDGAKTVYVQFKDQAGLTSTYSDTIVLDTALPTGSITIDEDATYTNSTSVTLTLSADDATSGVALMRLSHDNTIWTSSEAYSTSQDWTLTEGDGTKTVYIQYIDNAGLVSQSYSDTIILDTTSPAITITSPSSGYEIRSSTVSVTWTDSDETSGVSYCQIRLDDGSWIDVETNTSYSFTGVADGSHKVEVKATDKAGLSKQDYVEFIVNTSPLLGPGYIEEAVIAVIIVIVASGTAVYLLKFRRKT